MRWLRARFLCDAPDSFHFQDLLLHLSELARAIAEPSRRSEFTEGRALEEGLQPQREIERCESYRASCVQKREQSDQARTVAEKYAVMLSVERASYDEM